MPDGRKPPSTFNPSLYVRGPMTAQKRKAKNKNGGNVRGSGKNPQVIVRCTRCIDKDRECGGAVGRRCAPCIKLKQKCSFTIPRGVPNSGKQSTSAVQDNASASDTPDSPSCAQAVDNVPSPSPEPPSEEGEELFGEMEGINQISQAEASRCGSNTRTDPSPGERLVPEVVIETRPPGAQNPGKSTPQAVKRMTPVGSTAGPSNVESLSHVSSVSVQRAPLHPHGNKDTLAALAIREDILRQKFEQAKIEFEQAKVEMEVKAGEVETLRIALESARQQKGFFSSVIKIED